MLTHTKLLFSGAVMFGSRALEVSKAKSDYDFVMLKSNFYAMFKGENFNELPVENYFSVMPDDKEAFIILNLRINGNAKADLLVVKEQKSIEIVRDSIKYMKQTYRKDILSEKDLRIKLYEAELLHRGFVTHVYKD